MEKITIIGSGISGLSAGIKIQSTGIKPLILDKGRGIGGRMSRRRVTFHDKDYVFDHGAQYFTARNQNFRQFLMPFLEQRIIKIWNGNFSYRRPTKIQKSSERYVGFQGMNDLPKKMSEKLNLQTKTRVSKITYPSDHWLLETDNGETIKSERLLITTPTNQALDLIQDLQIETPVLSVLRSLIYSPCFCVMAVPINSHEKHPEDGIWPDSKIVSWIANQEKKGISKHECFVIHTSQEFSEDHVSEDPKKVQQKIKIEAETILERELEIVSFHRWLYSIPKTCHSEPFLRTDLPGPLYFAGDIFQGPRVEGAFLSGMRAGEQILKDIKIEEGQ